MIRAENISIALGGHVIFDRLSFDIADGQLFVILGQSGAGKSVLLRHLIGLMKPDQGSIIIDGLCISDLSERRLLDVRKNIGYLFQDGALFDFMNIYENLAFPLEEHTLLKRKNITQKVKNILHQVGLEGVENMFPIELSGGMRKRAALARSVILDCQYLFCDEPTSGLDPKRSYEIANLIREMTRNSNRTTVMTSHDIPNSLRIADRLAILQNGTFAAVGSKDDLVSSKDPFVCDFLNKYR